MAPDPPIVDSTLNRTLSSSGKLVNMGTAVVGDLRTYLRFYFSHGPTRGPARAST